MTPASIALDARIAATGRRTGGRQPFPGIPARVHLLGAGGAGVSGAARILLDHGHALTGADRCASEHTELLQSLGMGLLLGDAAGRLPDDAELVVRSAAVPLGDPCVVAAQDRGVPVLKYAELVGRITPKGRTLAVAGTHGKTTTSWMLHHGLRGLTSAAAELPEPGALVGGICRELGTNAVSAQPGGWFAVEACEYDRSFLQLVPRGAIVTNVEADHLDYYGDLDAIKGAFARFADRIHPEGLMVIGTHVPRRVEEAARCPVWRLGRDLHVQVLGERTGSFTFALRGPGFWLREVALQVPGSFNVENAALALGLLMGLCAADGHADAAGRAARGLEGFRGSQRRFEPWGRAGEVEVVHDYAHHPTEVQVTLEAARRAYPGRPLHVLFQPHQYSRTARFLHEFADSLRGADHVVVSDVYGARVHVDGENTAGAYELVEELAARGVSSSAGGPLRASVQEFARGMPQRSAAFVLGAGDIGGMKDELHAALALRRAGPGGSGQ